MQQIKIKAMQKILLRILFWLGVMAIMTIMAMGIWLVVFGGSQTTESLKWLQFLQTIGTFLLPPLICARLWAKGESFTWFGLEKGAKWQVFLLGIGIMICAIPGINLLADLNSRVELPESIDFLAFGHDFNIEQIFKQQEEAAAALTERFLQADSIGGLLINIGLMALLPALAEELSFRGTLQQIICKGQSDQIPSTKVHVAIWITAFIFSAIHMQFYGFVPRMLMGAMFGYIFVWTGSLWVPMTMHFVNNGLAVLAYYFFGQNSSADTIGTGATWWVGVVSLIITSLGLLIFYRKTHTR